MKYFLFTTLFVGLAVLMNLMGFNVAQSSLAVIGYSNGTFHFTVFVASAMALLTISAAATIVIGAITKSRPESYARYVFIFANYLLLTGIMGGIFIAAPTTLIKTITGLFLFPLAIGYAIAIYEFYGGTG